VKAVKRKDGRRIKIEGINLTYTVKDFCKCHNITLVKVDCVHKFKKLHINNTLLSKIYLRKICA
jgi:hypothetical protein